MKALLNSSNLVLFFSLPFKPVGRMNFFYNGHIALALDETVYHIVNPTLLKTDFLFSVMPVDSWLFGKGGKWVERDPSSPYYTHVYLYKKSESSRTVVYGAGLTVNKKIVESIREYFHDEDRRFKTGERQYDLFRSNCSSIIANALAQSGLIRKNIFNILPSSLFRGFVRNFREEVTLRSVNDFDRDRFRLHRLCYGLWGTDPKNIMDRWMATMARLEK